MDTVKDPFGARMVWNPETFDDRRQAAFSVTSFRDMALICEQFKESFPPSFTKWPILYSTERVRSIDSSLA
jgi:hypothetical protein